jgi:2'-5' RNA ligase
MEPEKKMRTFLAIDLPDQIKAELDKIQKRLKPKIEGVRWTRPEGIHLTLKFFGWVLGEDCANISNTVKTAIKGVKPFTLELGTIGAFPGPTRPRVIWIGLGGQSEALIDLQMNLDRIFEQIGFPPEDRTFQPHLTLGRIKVPGTAVGFAKVLEEGRDYKAGSFRCEGLTLFRSDLRPDGAIYTKLEEYPFK